MYRNRVIDGLLKSISKKAVGTSMWYYTNDVALNTACITQQQAAHLIPTFMQKKEQQFYDFILRVLPDDYVEYGQKALDERLSRPVSPS